jgi:capsular polysaccharide biosynthesis protein/cellulose biosynthesis protein BcsQ
MTETLPRDDVRARVVTGALKRHWRLLAAITVLSALGAAGLAHSRGPSYTSAATVLIRPLPGNALSTSTATSNQSTTVAMETEANLVTSLAVTERVNTALKTDVAPGNPNITAMVPTNSQIVRISAVARNAVRAQKLAETYATAFLDYRSDLATATQKAQLDKLNAQAAAIETALKTASAQAAAKNPPADALIKVRLYSSNLASVLAEIGQVEAVTTVPGNIVTPAAAPAAPSGPSDKVLIAAAAAIGLIIGLGIAIWRERADDRIRSKSEPTILGVPVLARIPDVGKASAKTGERSEAAREDAVRRARTGLLASAPLKSVIAVAGLCTAQQSTAIAAELARAMAAAGYHVSLVDAVIGEREHPAPFGLQGAPGLSDALLEPDVRDLPLARVDGIQVLSAGSDPADARERYSGQHLRDILERLRKTSEYVVVAASPCTTTDGLAVLLAVDSAVIIATDETATHEQIATTKDAIERLNVDVLGLIIRPDKGDAGSSGSSTTPAESKVRPGKQHLDAGVPHRPRAEVAAHRTNRGLHERPGAGRESSTGNSAGPKLTTAPDDAPGIALSAPPEPAESIPDGIGPPRVATVRAGWSTRERGRRTLTTARPIQPTSGDDPE